jgi:hypothetical protein
MKIVLGAIRFGEDGIELLNCVVDFSYPSCRPGKNVQGRVFADVIKAEETQELGWDKADPFIGWYDQ